MKKVPTYLLILLTLAFASCTVLFKHPQPSWIKTAETNFPAEICGTYILQIDSLKNKDTITITPTGFTGALSDSGYTISDSVILRRDGSFYYLNIKDKKRKAWDVFIISKEGDNLSLSALVSVDTMIPKLGTITHVRILKDGLATIYIINPRSKQFREILDKKLFTRFVAYRKM